MMVVDVDVLLALFLPLPCSDKASAKVHALLYAGEELCAPALAEYEICSALHRACSRGMLDQQTAAASMEELAALGVRMWPPTPALHRKALAWAGRLRHSVAYHAHYLALAEELGCGFLTADLNLARWARAMGASWLETLD